MLLFGFREFLSRFCEFFARCLSFFATAYTDIRCIATLVDVDAVADRRLAANDARLAKIRKRKGLAVDAALIMPVPDLDYAESDSGDFGEKGLVTAVRANDVNGDGDGTNAELKEGEAPGLASGSVDEFLAFFKEQSKAAV